MSMTEKQSAENTLKGRVMKIVVMKDESDGNDTVGSMWTETYIFDESATLKEVFNKVGDRWAVDNAKTMKATMRINILEEAQDEHM